MSHIIAMNNVKRRSYSIQKCCDSAIDGQRKLTTKGVGFSAYQPLICCKVSVPTKQKN